jgi:hypothetical protein
LAIFEAILLDTGTNKPLKANSFILEALLIKALLIKALLVETNELAILVNTSTNKSLKPISLLSKLF